MCKYRTPAARFRLSSHGCTGTGSQDYEANLVECIGRVACRIAVGTGLWLVFCRHPEWTGHTPVATTKMKSMTIYFVAGEVSADNHGAALMRSLRELKPGVQF